MNLLVQCLVVGSAGFLGAVTRLLVGRACLAWFGSAFPVGTLLVNVSGSFALGWFLTVIGERATISESFRLAVAVGFLGAYTTFSTFMFETTALLDAGAGLKAAAYLGLSLFLGILGVYAGAVLARGM